MPTTTFWNLPETKKEKIRIAAIKELASVSFDKVSINKIIKDADISRGSFYMYFEDIYDLILYLMEDSTRQVKDEMIRRGALNNGKLDEIILSYHDVMYDYYDNELYRNLFKNTMIYFQGRPQDEMRSLKGKFENRDNFELLSKILDPQDLSCQDEDFIKNVIELGFLMFRNTMFKTFIQNLNKNQSAELLKNYLEILKNGYRRK